MLVCLKEFFEKVDFEKKNQQTTKNMQNYPVDKGLKYFYNMGESFQDYSWIQDFENQNFDFQNPEFSGL